VLKSRISQLAPNHRRVLRMYYFEEMGSKQIGERLGVGEARVCQVRTQALAELRRIFDTKPPLAMAVNGMIH